MHLFNSAFLLLGPEKSLLVDTGHVLPWPQVAAQLDRLLAGRALDYVFPTHPEIAHSGSLPMLKRRYPELMIVGDIGDYAWQYPEFAASLQRVEPGETIELGGRWRCAFCRRP